MFKINDVVMFIPPYKKEISIGKIEQIDNLDQYAPYKILELDSDGLQWYIKTCDVFKASKLVRRIYGTK
jgi:hypothetical protein